ncbi:DgyrCDS4452 [Dimorphilus gyrociliatus]|uniref:beta-N-acetylhexosaminidase n=1 Tax=Dimorphilus gyrociliatus TaxID=2664684 RepID=A0A7I8VHK3_9ANNE|nr:DgyrCDS4452 [Dimorphilus gyrociliatus]
MTKINIFILTAIFLLTNVLYTYTEGNGAKDLLTIDDQLYSVDHDNLRVKPSFRKPLNSDGENRRRKKKRRRHRRPTLPPRPLNAHKKDVIWFEESRSYALKLSADPRFPLRLRPNPAQGSPWPLPQQYDTFEQEFFIQPDSFTIHAAGETCDILRFAFRRIRKNMFGHGSVQSDGYERQNLNDKVDEELRQLNVTVLKPCSKWPSLAMDEAYDLEVRRFGASIIAREVWGALKGLETFSQLVYRSSDNIYRIHRTLINDFPRFPHRGILLDTSRHFLTKETIIMNLEAMAQNKMNVFHWHIVDDQSFPFYSKNYPNLTRMGAYSKHHIYSPADVAEILEEARLRGIRVIPEFDTPGHTWSWGLGQDFLLTPCYDLYTNELTEMFGPINPILRGTYNFLRNFFTEVLTVFKDKYIHLGGDEVPFDCWSFNPQISNFMKRNNITNPRQLLGIYEKKLFDIINDLGSKRATGSSYVVWQEVFDNGLKIHPDTIIEIWMGDATDIERVTNSGLRAIYSTCWYLDYINTGVDWDKYYLCEQLDPAVIDDMNIKNISLLIGGEACMWTEYVDNENILSRLWPRASAAAERLWSDKRVRDVQAAAPRIEMQRCRMLATGIPVGVLSGPGSCPSMGPGPGAKRNENDVVSPQRQRKGVDLFKFRSDDDIQSDREDLAKHTVPKRSKFDSDEIQVRQYSDNAQLSTRPKAYCSVVYLVDMSAMYVIPVIIVLILFLYILINSTGQEGSRITILPTLFTRTPGKRPLIAIFVFFILIWVVWSAPIWMNTWEKTHAKRVAKTRIEE